MAAFSDELHAEDVEADAKLLPVERRYGAYADGSLVGTAADFALTVSIPGGELAAAGVTMVGVVPSHRRQGALTRLMRRQLMDARSRGESLAILWASEGAIYGRYGYGVATRVVGIDADRASIVFDAPDPGAAGAAGRLRRGGPRVSGDLRAGAPRDTGRDRALGRLVEALPAAGSRVASTRRGAEVPRVARARRASLRDTRAIG